jgi:hypothetical protein
MKPSTNVALLARVLKMTQRRKRKCLIFDNFHRSSPHETERRHPIWNFFYEYFRGVGVRLPVPFLFIEKIILFWSLNPLNNSVNVWEILGNKPGC